MNLGEDLIDNLYVQLKEHIEKDEERWKNSSDDKFTAAGPVKTSMDEQYSKIRDFYTRRFKWMEENLDKIEKLHQDIAYFQSLNLITAKADTVNKQFQIYVNERGTPEKKISGYDLAWNNTTYDKYVVRNVHGETVTEGKARESFYLSFEVWASGEYYLEVTIWNNPLISAIYPATSGGFPQPQLMLSFVKPPPEITYTSAVELQSPYIDMSAPYASKSIGGRYTSGGVRFSGDNYP
ncbi:MAG: hypothetical protein HRT57_10750 [Crocinitomicaceae bacterium]|nr:hypothetical protein [Crocinitomicaceae bacterium]